MNNCELSGPDSSGRLISLDLFRGVVIFLLIGAATGLFDLFLAPPKGLPLISLIGRQFRHTPWEGIRLFDLGQPFFMFISGVAMVFSYQKRWSRGETWKSTFLHCLFRAGLLLLLGWALFHINSSEGATQAELYAGVLPQLAAASVVAFLLMKQPGYFQIAMSAAILLVTESLYRLWPIPGIDRPFIPGKNFGSYLDLKLFGGLSGLNIVAFNIVPAMVYVIMGVAAAGLLRRAASQRNKLAWLIGSGVIGVMLGLALSFATPIIRRIETSSFVILAVGLAFWALALAHWLAEMRGLTSRSSIFIAVGRNPLLIFLFAFSGGALWLQAIVKPFAMSFEGWIGAWGSQVLTSFLVWGMMCGICIWLYNRRIIFKI